MAKLKDKINDLKVKYSISDEAAREVLALYDGDILEANALLTEEQNKVVEWNKFWFEKQPQIEALANEYEKVKTQLDTVTSTINGVQPNTNTQPNPQPNPQTPDLASVEQRIYQNFSAVQRDLEKVRKYHFDNYKTLPDIEPIEKLIEEKKLTPWAAYQEWVAPMELERKDKELREKITKELTEKMQNEATRSGVNSYLLTDRSRTTGEEVTSPLDEVLKDQSNNREQSPQAVAAAAQAKDRNDATVGPSEFDLMTDFVQSMRTGRAGIAH
jgi:hypothetical protein